MDKGGNWNINNNKISFESSIEIAWQAANWKEHKLGGGRSDDMK